jgi:hypothetical protein
MQHWQRQATGEWLRLIYGLSPSEAALLVHDDEDAMFVHELVVNARDNGKTLRQTQHALRQLVLLLREFRQPEALRFLGSGISPPPPHQHIFRCICGAQRDDH